VGVVGRGVGPPSRVSSEGQKGGHRCWKRVLSLEGSRDWRVEGVLKEKVQEWRAEERGERREERGERRGGEQGEGWMDINDEEARISEESQEIDEDDSEEIRNLKARRRYLKSLLLNSQRPPQPQRRRRNVPKQKASASPSSQVVQLSWSTLTFSFPHFPSFRRLSNPIDRPSMVLHLQMAISHSWQKQLWPMSRAISDRTH
jgi:hypothetical protein